MNALLCGTTLLTAAFTVFGALGAVYFENLRAENIGENSVTFFLVLLFFLVGVMGLLAHRQTSTLFKLASRLKKFVVGAYASVCGALVGWPLGLTIYSLLMGEFGNALIGTLLTTLILVVFGSPLQWARAFEENMHDFGELRFRKKRHSYIFNLSYFALIGVAMWGFVQISNLAT
jgi:hypothetical protein